VNVTFAILGLALLILVHEAGHFFVARAVGMRPRKFYIGFPPALAKVRRNGIEYGIGSIPLGGYVKIPGMHRPAPSDVDAHLGRAATEANDLERPVERLKRHLAAGDMDAARADLPAMERAVEEAKLEPLTARAAERGVADLEDALSSDAYWRQRTWKKVAVILAGPATNLVFAVALLAVVYMIGVPVGPARSVEEVLPDSPAASMGLRPGDRVVAVGTRPVGPDDIASTIQAGDGRPLSLTVLRGGERVRLRAVRPEQQDGAFRLGFRLDVRYESYGPLSATENAAEDTWQVTKGIAGSLGGIVTGERRDEVASAVGIVEGSSRALEAGTRYYLQVLALISLSLALLNLLPLLPLDGGHITFSLIEGIRGRAIGRAVYERASMVGLAVVLLLFAVGLSNDISRLRGG
jgi:regulator of sigma E protease